MSFQVTLTAENRVAIDQERWNPQNYILRLYRSEFYMQMKIIILFNELTHLADVIKVTEVIRAAVSGYNFDVLQSAKFTILPILTCSKDVRKKRHAMQIKINRHLLSETKMLTSFLHFNEVWSFQYCQFTTETG